MSDTKQKALEMIAAMLPKNRDDSDKTSCTIDLTGKQVNQILKAVSIKAEGR